MAPSLLVKDEVIVWDPYAPKSDPSNEQPEFGYGFKFLEDEAGKKGLRPINDWLGLGWHS